MLSDSFKYRKVSIKPLSSIAPFLYLLKTSENLRFFNVLRGL